MSDSIGKQFPNQRTHDPRDLAAAWQIAKNTDVIPVGLLYHNPDAPCYEDASSKGADITAEARLEAVNTVLDSLTI